MADNVDITPGSGKTVRTDEVGGVQIQVMKIALGADGSEDLLLDSGQQTMANSLPIVIASDQGILSIGGTSVQIDLTVASAASAYSSGDMVGAELTLTNIARINGGTGKITGIRVEDDAAQSVACELWIFDTAITEPADNAAWSISDADIANIVTVVPVSAYYASALNSVAPIPNLSIPFKCTGSTRDLKLCLVTRGAPTYTANALHIRIWADQD